MQRTNIRCGISLRLYLAVSRAFPVIAPMVLRKRLRKGKEHPDRWQEKRSQVLAPRPKGQLIWLNAVGLGEVLSLRGLIASLAKKQPDLSFLVTSTTRTSAEVFAANLPSNTTHQFLPIDAPGYRKRFLDHFTPDLCIWAEQDIWPGFVYDLAQRNIPQTIVAARMNYASYKSHNRARGLYRNVYQMMTLIAAQDARTAAHLDALGAGTVKICGSLKPCAPPLTHDPVELATIQNQLSDRTVWAAAPSHEEDESIALEAHQTLLKQDPSALLIMVPRYPTRGNEIADNCPIPLKRYSLGETPDAATAVWLCDSFGKLGLIYRVAKAVLIGGTFNKIEGHSPWEAVALHTAIYHGPRTGNFVPDFEALTKCNAAQLVNNAADLAAQLGRPDLEAMTQQADKLLAQTANSIDELAGNLLTLMDKSDD